jgi:pimeloyl-ACP methyl ester carboxylesterase
MQNYPNITPTTSCYFQADDGLQLHYLFWPNTESQSCCLLIHGFTNDAHIWDGLAEKLQQHHNVVAIDMRGHGDSEWDKEEKYTHPQMVEDVFCLLQNLSFSKMHIIGHSLGARVATLLISRKEIRPNTFTIIDTGPEVRAVGVNKVRQDAQSTPSEFVNTESFYQYLSKIYIFAQAERIRSMAEYGLKLNSAKKLTPKTDPAFTRALWKTDSQQGSSDDLKYPLTDELWKALANIKSPTLILKGQASAILAKKTAEKMAFEVMPNATLKIISRAGHAMMVDNPSEFESVVCDFINQHST